jgi:glutamine synthetase
LAPDNVELFEKYHVLDAAELHAHYQAKAEQYAKLVNIEANTMSYMVHHLYLPAILSYSNNIATGVATKESLGLSQVKERELLTRLTSGFATISTQVEELEAATAAAKALDNVEEQDNAYCHQVLPLMKALRATVDSIEPVVGEEFWPVPSYNDMLFYT